MNADALLVGLGNPGPRYSFTRHNIGFIALDVLAQDQNTKFTSKGLGQKIQAETAEVTLRGKKVLLVKPQTFMNLSGESLGKLFQIYNHLREVPLIVAHDEADIALGRIRVKLGGGDAGHNGLKSIRAVLGHGDYYRVRLGVGRPDPASGIALADHVLRPFEKNEEDLLMKELSQAEGVFEALVERDLRAALAVASRDLMKS